jgi:hypothetical protein
MKPSAGILFFSLCAFSISAQDTTTWAIQFAYSPNRSISYFYQEMGPLLSNEFEFGGRIAITNNWTPLGVFSNNKGRRHV